MHTDQAETTQGHQAGELQQAAVTQKTPDHLDESHPPKVQKAHIRKRLGDIDLLIVQLQNEKKDLRELHSSLK